METFPSHLMRERKSRAIVKEETKLWKVNQTLQESWSCPESPSCRNCLYSISTPYNVQCVHCTMYNVCNVYNVQLVLHCLPSPWSDNATCREHSSVDAKIFETCTATAIMDLWVGWGTGYCSLGTGQGALCSACPGGRTGQSQPCGGLIMECTPHCTMYSELISAQI